MTSLRTATAMTPVRPTSRARWVGRVLGGAALSVALGSLLWYVGVLPHGYLVSVALALALGLVVLLVVWTAQEQGPHLEAATWYSPVDREAVSVMALDYHMLRLRRDLRAALERNDRPDEIYPLIVELAAERLAARHAIDLRTRPEEARRVLAPGLAAYLDKPPEGTERRSRRQLERAIEGIEEL
ncbi:MAG TPA: hypothetical protein VK038_10940 [Ornithinicoccus sp.]|nr:hypothetical protein [Ornithinicoccus sp.]